MWVTQRKQKMGTFNMLSFYAWALYTLTDKSDEKQGRVSLMLTMVIN